MTEKASKPLINARRNTYKESSRKCRDIFCTMFMLVFWFGMFIVTLVGLKYGNPQRLIYPMDHDGNLCTPEKPNLFFPHPEADFIGSGQDDPSKVAYFGICVHRCPKEGDQVEGYSAPIDTRPLLHRCLPAQGKEEELPQEYKYIYGKASGVLEILGRYVSDIRITYKPILLFGGVMGFGLSLFWVGMLRACPSVIVWLSIALAMCCFLVGTIIMAVNAKLIKNDVLDKYSSPFEFEYEKNDVVYYQLGTGLLVLIDIVFLLTVVYLHSRINLSIGILKEAARSISHVPMLLLFPFVPAGALLILLAYFVASSAYIGSSDSISFENIKETTGVTQVTYTEKSNVMWFLFAYNVFGVLWTQQLIEAIMICSVASAVCRYYWTDRKGELGWAVGGSLYNCIRYSFGSLAFGACVLAVVQFFRMIFEYIDRYVSNNKNQVVRVITCCCRFCLYCLHKVMKYLSKTGYIMVALKGTGFCTSITEAFELLAANAVRIATVSLISGYVLILGKLFITSVCSFSLYWFLSVYSVNKAEEAGVENEYIVNSIFPSLVICAVLSWGMSCFYLGVYDIAVDTILFSVCEDEKINQMTGTYYASSQIRQYLDNSAKHALKHHQSRRDNTNVYAGI